jgi:asparagine synthase (glutamine-hydrolysing)
MSIQFGIWNFDGEPADREFIRGAAVVTAKYAVGEENICVRGPIGMSFQSFDTTNECLHEHQPLTNSAGVMLTWDGRLDNRDELIRLADFGSASSVSDAEIALVAYTQWDTACFGKLIGDWALTLWDPMKQALLFAKDFVGTRHLFYVVQANRITWCTVTDPLVVLGKHSFEISEEFIAGYISTYPKTHLTPFSGINAVPASTFVQIERGRSRTQEYWQFDPSHRIRYRNDSEYEQHFRQVFAEAVRRRLRSSFPVLAELSGGMDSTSIVCVADTLIAEGKAETPRLETISYYDDNEPNWNERPYFSLVEKKRGRTGVHINVGSYEGALEMPEGAPFCPLPGYDKLAFNRSREFSRSLESSGCRVLLSGIGGDEFLGGVPTPTPELQTLFTQLHWVRFFQQLSKWSLQKRRPLTHLCFETLEEFLPQTIRTLYKRPKVAPWLSGRFVRSNAGVFWLDMQRTHLTGSRPSFQSCITALNHLRRQLNISHLGNTGRYRVSYPYFDRDLLTFLFAIPREQIVRPGQRRSLMRRALAGVVPSEILDRKRKAFVARHPLALLRFALPTIETLLQSPLVLAYGWVDQEAFWETLTAAVHGQTQLITTLQRILLLELWLKMLVKDDVLRPPAANKRRPSDIYLETKAAVLSRV